MKLTKMAENQVWEANNIVLTFAESVKNKVVILETSALHNVDHPCRVGSATVAVLSHQSGAVCDRRSPDAEDRTVVTRFLKLGM